MSKKVIGFTCSTFDLFHSGHVVMLEEAKSVCDHLIVGIQSDPTIDRNNKNRPVQSLLERQLQVRACKYVDEIIVYDTEADLENILKMLPINIRIIGEDYMGKFFTGKQLCLDKKILIHYNKRLHDYSSSELRERIKEIEK